MPETSYKIHFCARCGKPMRYEEKWMAYLYKVEEAKSHYRMRSVTRPVAKQAHNLCGDCAEAFNGLTEAFMSDVQGTAQETALSFLYRELRAAKISLGNAQGRKGVKPEEITNLENRIKALDWLIPLALKEG